MKTIELYRNNEKVRERIFKDLSEAKTLFGQWLYDIRPLLSKHTFYIKIYESEENKAGLQRVSPDLHEGVQEKSTLPGLHEGINEKN